MDNSRRYEVEDTDSVVLGCVAAVANESDILKANVRRDNVAQHSRSLPTELFGVSEGVVKNVDVFFLFEKPKKWTEMPLFKKIKYYATQLDGQFSPYVDKIEAKKIVKNMCGDNIHLAPIIRILENPDDFLEIDINVNNMVKAAHGSGWNINMNQDTTVDNVKSNLQIWNRIYSHTERQYTYIKPRFFIEQKINGPAGDADVFMIRCIHGQPVTIGLRRGYIQNIYDINWNPLMDIKIANINKPAHLDKMLQFAGILSSPFEFVRIDYYYVDDIIYFSEFTFSPAAGQRLLPLDIEHKLGSMWL
jgi:hypothetical protein